VPAADERRRLRRGLTLGVLAVGLFSLTLPATRAAVAGFDPVLVALGRAQIAAMVAAVILLATGTRRPTSSEWPGLAVVAACVVLGFPLLMSWAMVHVPAAHGAVVLAALPIATAVAAVWRAGERPSPIFWVAALAGSALVATWAIAGTATPGSGHALADVALAAAVVVGGLGYAEGGRLARSLGGWQVICWALVLPAPLLLLPTLLLARDAVLPAAPGPWVGFLYVALVSQLAGFFPWYRALALGGIARVGQVQLLQPFLTLAASVLLLGESITATTVAFAVAVVGTVALSTRTGVRRDPEA
jgi:drug/metabolite transporter (DMT)-like permease